MLFVKRATQTNFDVSQDLKDPKAKSKEEEEEEEDKKKRRSSIFKVSKVYSSNPKHVKIFSKIFSST